MGFLNFGSKSSKVENKETQWTWGNLNKPKEIEQKAYDTGSDAIVKSGDNRGSSISFVDHLQNAGYYGLGFDQMISYYNKCSPLANAVDLIAEGVAGITPIVKDRNTGEIVDHEVLNLLEYPCDSMDYADFAKDAVSMQLLTNNPFLELVGDTNKPPVALDIIRPNVITLNADRVGDLGQIIVRSQFRGVVFNSEDVMGRARFRSGKGGEDGELWPMMGFNPRRGSDVFFAPSNIEALYAEIEQYIMGNTHNAALLANGARPGGMFFTDPKAPPLSDKQFSKLQDEIEKNYRGPANAGNPLLLEWTHYKEMIVNNRDMDFANLKTDARNSIYRRWKIPLALVDSKAMTYSNFGNAAASLYTMAIIPAAEYFYKQLKNGLMYRYGSDWMRYNITYDPSTIPALVTQMVENAKNKSIVGVYEVNEIRESIGLEHVKGGDVILRPANDVPALDNGEDDYEDDDDSDSDNSGNGISGDNNNDEIDRGNSSSSSDDDE